ncbi:hypothetical protein [Dongia sp.]|uniref:hypothetical protein n=1 Tax=Dongia sp. TaxID=1977262 RepID=UPI003752ECF5
MSESAGSADSRFVLPFRISTRIAIAAGAILLAALILRILGADGDLWLDELWSLKLIDEVKARHDVFWGLAVDNNHYLNTLWLWVVGADAPVLLQRAFSIALGVATVAAAGLALCRTGVAGMFCAMILFAVSYPMVNYGSEARGYAGLILMTLLAILLTESATAGSLRDRRRLGFVNLAAVLFQPIALGGICGLILWSVWMNRPAAKPDFAALRRLIVATEATFSWTVRLLIPVAALITYAVLHAEGYRIAGTDPFTAAGFVAGYGGMLHLLLGLPDAAPDWVALLIGAGVCALGLLLARRRSPNFAALTFIFLVVLPLAMFIARLPNIHFPRYYLASAVVFLLVLADLFAAAWARGAVLRLLGAALLLAIAIGNLADVSRLLRDGRDQSATVMKMIAGAGPVLVTSDQDVRNRPIVEFFAARFDLPLTYVPTQEICAKQPEWLLSSSLDAEMPETLDTSIVGCPKIYRKEASFPQWGLSGLPWTVYRAEHPQ